MAVRVSKEREVVNVIPPNQVLLGSFPPFPHIEMREKQDGTWMVWYPDPAWIPCAPVCRLKETQRDHKHSYEQGWIQTNYSPSSYDDALVWAELLAEGREVKIIAYLTAAEKRAAKALTTDA